MRKRRSWLRTTAAVPEYGFGRRAPSNAGYRLGAAALRSSVQSRSRSARAGPLPITSEDSSMNLSSSSASLSGSSGSPLRLGCRWSKRRPSRIVAVFSAHVPTPELLRAHSGMRLFDWIAEGRLKVRIDGVYPMAEAARPHADVAGRATTGKLLPSSTATTASPRARCSPHCAMVFPCRSAWRLPASTIWAAATRCCRR